MTACATLPSEAVDPDVSHRAKRVQLPRLAKTQVILVLLAAIAFDVAARTGVSSLSSTIGVGLIVGPLLAPRLRSSRYAAVFAAAAVVFAILLPMRASTWLAWLNATAVALALAGAVVTANGLPRRFGTASLSVLFARLWSGRHGTMLLMRSVRPVAPRKLRWFVPVIRGLLIAALPIAVLGSLLASADAVFASALSLDFDPSGLVTHSIEVVLIALFLTGLIAIVVSESPVPSPERRPLGAVEASILLGSIGSLYGTFAFVQLYAALGRADAVLAGEGLTYSQYARAGFFQLIWVGALTALLLGVVRLLVAPSGALLDRAVRSLGAAVSLLTCLVVAVALVRLGLYIDEFGQTTLRWYSTAFAWMLGAGFVLIAIGHLRSVQRHLTRALLALVAITLFSINVLNPEARVAAHNLTRADAATSLDVTYLTRLSADAWPELLARQDVLAQAVIGASDGYLRQFCLEADRGRGYGVLGLNLAQARLDCPR